MIVTSGGPGIGPLLVNGLVELQRRHVEGSSDGLGTGSQFAIRQQCLAGDARRRKARLPDPSMNVEKRCQRVLIADDNHDAALNLAALLEVYGYEVLVAHDGPGALELARKFKPAVVLLDIGMPGLNGFEVAKIIRHEAWGKHLFLVAATGWGREDDRFKGVAAGFDAYLTKPFKPDALLALISAHLHA